MTILHLTADNFDETVQKNACVVVDFWASWCAPCLAFSPIFEEVSRQFPEVVFAKVDIEKEPQLAEDFQIRSIPYLMVFRHEFAVYADSGVQSKTNLGLLVKDALSLDIEELRKQLK